MKRLGLLVGSLTVLSATAEQWKPFIAGDRRCRWPDGTAHIAGAKFVSFDQEGHASVAHGDDVRAKIVKLLLPQAQP